MLIDEFSFIQSDTSFFTSFDKFHRIVFNVVKRADEDDIIDIGMNGLAPSTGEIKEEKSCCLTNIAAVTLPHT